MGVQLNEDKIYHLSVTFSGADVLANTTAEQDITITGVKTTDTCLTINKKTAQAGLGIVNQRVKSANTVSVTYSNNTGSTITPTAADTYSITLLRPEKTYATVPA